MWLKFKKIKQVFFNVMDKNDQYIKSKIENIKHPVIYVVIGFSLFSFVNWLSFGLLGFFLYFLFLYICFSCWGIYRNVKLKEFSLLDFSDKKQLVQRRKESPIYNLTVKLKKKIANA